MQLSERSRFPQVFPLAVHTAFNTNTGVLRARPTVDDGGKVVGVECDWFHPKHVCFYPAAVERVVECKTVGHRFFQGLWEIEAKQRARAYYRYADPIVAGDDPDRDEATHGRFDRVTGAGADTVDAEDGFVECWELITRCRIGGEWRTALAVLARSSQRLLSLQEYPYDRPWYEIVRPLRTEKRVLTNDSVAQGVQGYCLAAQDLMNAIVGGAYMTAYPVVWMKGYLGPTQAKTYTAAEVIPLGPDGQMGVLGMPFDAQKFAGALEKFEQLVDATVGISRMATNQMVHPETKAAAIHAIAAGDERRQATYLDAVAESVEGIFGMFLEFLRVHHRELADTMGGAVAALDPQMLERTFRLEVTGRSGASNPGALLQKLQFLMQVAANPQSTLDYGKVEGRAVDALDLPFNTAGLERDALTQMRSLFEQLTAAQVDPMRALTVGLQILEANGQLGPNQEPVPNRGMGASAGVPPGAPGGIGGGADAVLARAAAGAPGGDPGARPIPPAR
ncbi:MAG: portal protein [Fimbriimonas sp.]